MKKVKISTLETLIPNHTDKIVLQRGAATGLADKLGISSFRQLRVDQLAHGGIYEITSTSSPIANQVKLIIFSDVSSGASAIILFGATSNQITLISNEGLSIGITKGASNVYVFYREVSYSTIYFKNNSGATRNFDFRIL